MSAELQARPLALRAAVDALPPADRAPRPPRVSIEAFRERLLALDPDGLGKMRMSRRAREALPYLAVEPALRGRVLVLARAEVTRIPWPSLARLYPWLFDDLPLRQGVARRASEGLPRGLPAWLARHGSQALGASPARSLAEAAVPLVSLLSKLELLSGTPLAEAVLEAAVRGDDDWLGRQPYTATLRWIERSGASPSVRRRLLARIVGRWPEVAALAEQIRP